MMALYNCCITPNQTLNFHRNPPGIGSYHMNHDINLDQGHTKMLQHQVKPTPRAMELVENTKDFTSSDNVFALMATNSLGQC